LIVGEDEDEGGTGSSACKGAIHSPFGSFANPNASKDDFGLRGDTAVGDALSLDDGSSNKSTSATAESASLIRPAFFSNTTKRLNWLP
jgi:hypothetical protein